MPTYVYRREDGSTFEIQQRITEDPLTECPETGQPVRRVISGNAGLIFKGSGFYLTDYARKTGAHSNGGDSSTGSTEKSTSDEPAKAASSTSES